MSKPPVTLQISLAPSDFAHARQILPHQIRTWQGQYDELLLTIDVHRSHGRFSDGWETGHDGILQLAGAIPDARVVLVDYGADAHQRVSAEFFGGRRIPKKDHRGGPYYSYFFALAEARNDHVLHLDSDLLFGGGSPTWVSEAINHLAQHEDILFASPLPGPPRADGRLLDFPGKPSGEPGAFQFDGMSTRLFLMSRRRFRARIGSLRTRRPGSWRHWLIALLERNPVEELPEQLFSDAMRANRMVRWDFLGRPPGMWSLHPPYRCSEFYRGLTVLIKRCERGDLPESQRGCQDLNDDMVDWTEARRLLASNRIWRRLLRRT